MTGFTRPQTNLYRTFLHLDGDSVINCLSGLEGGDIDEVLTRVASESGRDLGGELDARVIRGRAGKKKSERYEEEMRRKRTEHSAAVTLLKKLHEADAVGRIDGAYGPDIHVQLDEQMTLEIKADLLIHPLHQVVAAARELTRVGPAFGVPKSELRDVSDVANMLETMFRNAPPLPMERQGMAEAVPDFVDAMQQLGVEVSTSDFALTFPSVLLRPICIFK